MRQHSKWLENHGTIEIDMDTHLDLGLAA